MRNSRAFELWCQSNADEAEFWAEYDVELVARGVDAADIVELLNYYNGQFFQVEFGPELQWWNVFYPTDQMYNRGRRNTDQLYTIARQYPGYPDNLYVHGYTGAMWDSDWKAPAYKSYQDIDWRDPKVMSLNPPLTFPKRGN